MKIQVLILLIGLAVCYNNNPPVPERHPGFLYGSFQTGIQIDFVYDITCSDCKHYDPIVQEFLDTNWLDSTVRNVISFNYVVMPLPYHHDSWIPTKLIPYFLDQCYDNMNQCQYYEYLNYTLLNQDFILQSTDLTYLEIIDQWSQKVSQQFGIDQQELSDIYNNKDSHNSESRTRTMWKWATSNGVSGTPTAFVNGVMLQEFPGTVDEWMELVKELHGEQKAGFLF